MKTPCEQVREWMDDLDRPALPVDLEAHAAVCPACRPGVTVEATLREGLGAGAAVDPARRATLMQKALAAPAASHAAATADPGRRPARPARRLLRWSWLPLAAAAAVILALALAWPAGPRNPILLTEVFGDFLGPLVNLALPETAPAAPAEGAEVLPAQDVLGTFWEDFEGPIAVAQGALEAPRAAVAVPAAPVKTEKP